MYQNKFYPCTTKGFSIVELMIALAIFGILTSAAIPSYSAFMTNNRLSNENTALMLDFVMARAEAATRGTRVTVCQSANGTSCSSGGWKSGRIVFVDGGAAGVIGNGDEILKVSSAINAADDMTSTESDNYISYNAAGVVNNNMVITTCKSGFTGVKVTIYPSGRISKDKAGTC
jgi:type IV fimbrial biogenesis protein FimT